MEKGLASWTPPRGGQIFLPFALQETHQGSREAAVVDRLHQRSQEIRGADGEQPELQLDDGRPGAGHDARLRLALHVILQRRVRRAAQRGAERGERPVLGGAPRSRACRPQPLPSSGGWIGVGRHRSPPPAFLPFFPSHLVKGTSMFQEWGVRQQHTFLRALHFNENT